MFLNGRVAYDDRLDGLDASVFKKIGKGLKKVARAVKKSPGHRLTTKLLKKLPGAKRIEKSLKKAGKSPRFRKLLVVVVAAVATYFTFGLAAGPALSWVAANAKMLYGLATVAMSIRSKKKGGPGADPETEQAAAEGEAQIRTELLAAGFSSAQAEKAIANLRAGMDPGAALVAIGPPALAAPPPAGPRLTAQQVVEQTTSEIIPAAPARGAPAAMLIATPSGAREPEWGNLIERPAPLPARIAAPAATPGGNLPAWLIPVTLTAGLGVLGALTDAFKRR
jgi:hypothetical protein